MKNEIPKILHSYATDEPFTNCIDCDKHLLEDGVTYMVEKAIKQYIKDGYSAQEVLFEYAICTECAEKVKQKMSKESREAIDNYMMGNHTFHNASNGSLNCMIKGGAVEEYQEYQVFSLFQGNNMMTPAPMAIGSEALEELGQLISNETLDELDRLKGDYFGTPPELEELLPNHRVPFLI